MRTSRMKQWALGLGLALFISLSGCAEKDTEKSPEKTAESDPWHRVDAFLSEALPEDEPGAAVAVVHGDRRFVRGYGLARLDPNVAAKPDTPFRLASVSKTMTSIGVLKLVDQGMIALDDEVAEHIQDFPYDEIRVRDLLQHTSGLPHYEKDFGRALVQAKGEPTNADMLQFLIDEQPELLFDPGERYDYCNAGYDLLALLIEEVTGKSFADYMKEAIFEPLGMKGALVGDPAALPADRAYGYFLGESGAQESNDHPLNHLLGAGGIFASAEDMAEWGRALEPGQLLSAELLEALETPPALADGPSEYGLGWIVLDGDHGRELVHDGTWVGTATSFLHVKEEDLTVAVLMNSDRDSVKIATGIQALMLSTDG